MATKELGLLKLNPTQKLIFVIGKGGVGRTSVSAALATKFAAQKQKVLVVQWALNDAISPFYSLPPCSHKETSLPSGFDTMNFNPKQAIAEYFIDHLKMKWIYSLVIENKHVQKFLNAAPGISELFFLGRLFWLIELSEKERGFAYDKVIVDTQATGHGISLFNVAPAVAKFGLTGPLAIECKRVARLLADSEKTGVVFVTLPEELPVEEIMESLPKVTKQLGYKPLSIVVNQSLNSHFFSNLSNLVAQDWYRELRMSLNSPQAQEELDGLSALIDKKNLYEEKVVSWAAVQNIPVQFAPDFHFISRQNSPLEIFLAIAELI